MNSCLITTVGVSLIRNLKRNKINMFQDFSIIANEIIQQRNLDGMSAEIDSINSILNEGVLEKRKDLYLLVTDTQDSNIAGQILKEIYQNKFEKIHLITIDGLNSEDANQFRDEGLRNLVKAIVQIYTIKRKANEECVINATGGYKATVSFAGMIGQVLNIPVYYQYENFDQIIKLPNLPISLDMKAWIQHYHLIEKIYNAGTLSKELLGDSSLEELQGFIEESRGHVRLSSVGILMREVLWESFSTEGRLFLPSDTDNPIEPENTENIIKVLKIDSPAAFPIGLETMLESISRMPYTTNIRLIDFKENLPSKNLFKIVDGSTQEIQGQFSDLYHTWSFIISTKAKNQLEQNSVCIDLNQRLIQQYNPNSVSSVEFILVRHGQHVGEKEKRIEGWADFQLTEYGYEQARAVAEKLKNNYKIDGLYCSTLTRARQTAEIIGESIAKAPILIDDLRAMNYGKPGGKTIYEAEVMYPLLPNSKPIYGRDWDGESEIEFNRRVVEKFYEIFNLHPGQTVVIVTHGRSINAILKEALNLQTNLDFRIDSEDTSIHHFVFGKDKTFLKCLNNAEHLKGLL